MIKKHSPIIHIILFFISLATTIIAGMEWISPTPGPYSISELVQAVPYSFSILFIITVHEFGHYFAARYHHVKTTLPYYIPFPPIAGFLNFGTMGAVIRTRSIVKDNKAMFDIGVAGPIAGFFAALIVLIYGYTHLPGTEYILAIHPDYFSESYGEGTIALEFGNTILFQIFNTIFDTPDNFIPPMSEIYHYPYLTAGWLGLFITAMNMIPVDQLDGGHVIYSMFNSKKHEAVASISMVILIIPFLGYSVSQLIFISVPFSFTKASLLI